MSVLKVYTENGWNPVGPSSANNADIHYSDLNDKPQINGHELVGDKSSSDLGLSSAPDNALSDTSENPIQNKVIKTALDGKASSMHTHTKSEVTDFPSTETWTFTLEDNTTVTKLVYVG